MSVEWGGPPRRTQPADPLSSLSSVAALLFALAAAVLIYLALAFWVCAVGLARALRALWRKVN